MIRYSSQDIGDDFPATVPCQHCSGYSVLEGEGASSHDPDCPRRPRH